MKGVKDRDTRLFPSFIVHKVCPPHYTGSRGIGLVEWFCFKDFCFVNVCAVIAESPFIYWVVFQRHHGAEAKSGASMFSAFSSGHFNNLVDLGSYSVLCKLVSICAAIAFAGTYFCCSQTAENIDLNTTKSRDMFRCFILINLSFRWAINLMSLL